MCMHAELSDLISARWLSVVLLQAGIDDLGCSGLVAAGEQLVDLRTPPLRRCVGVLLPLDEGERSTFQRARWPPTDEFPQVFKSHGVAADRCIDPRPV